MGTTSAPGPLSHRDLALPVTAGLYHDIQHFLFRESLLLDHRRFDEWTALLSSDAVICLPARFAREIGMECGAGADHFQYDRQAISARFKRLQQQVGSDAGQRLSTKTRRFITNVIVCACDRDEYNVLSYLLVTRSGPGEAESQVLSAERYDRLRSASNHFKIVRREIVMDQTSAANADIDMYL
jgi:3-phenylpropionate/cinnamic acid dioxygenase small subunit